MRSPSRATLSPAEMLSSFRVGGGDRRVLGLPLAHRVQTESGRRQSSRVEAESLEQVDTSPCEQAGI